MNAMRLLLIGSCNVHGYGWWVNAFFHAVKVSFTWQRFQGMNETPMLK